MSKIFTTTLRLNLEKETDRRAFDYLRRMDKRQFRSYSGAIVTAVNAYFEEQERIAANPGYPGWGSTLAPPSRGGFLSESNGGGNDRPSECNHHPGSAGYSHPSSTAS